VPTKSPSEAEHQPVRIPDLERSLNFRDLGGYSSTDGRSVKWRTLFRSGTTHAMTDKDLERLAHLRFAYDLRSNRERLAQPNRLARIPGLSYHCLDHAHVGGDIQRLFASGRAMPEDAHALMIELYRGLPHQFAQSFRALFDMLGRGDVPLAFNCAAGKDRTGVAAALILAALGVPREVIFEDYLLTERFFERSCELLLNEHYRDTFANVQPAVWEPLMHARPEYLHAMFGRLDEMHRGVEGYLFDALGLGAHDIEGLRHRLLV
jgi:protein-tyrosine phosphatase